MISLDISDDALSQLRRAVTIGHAVPGVSVRVRAASGRELIAGRAPLPSTSEDRATVPICWLRAAVAAEWNDRSATPAAAASDGAPRTPVPTTSSRSVQLTPDPEVTLDVHPSRSELSFGVLRFLQDDEWMHVLAVSGDGPTVMAAAEVVAADPTFVGVCREVTVFVAEDLGVCLLVQSCPPSEVESETTALVLRTVALRVAIDQLPGAGPVVGVDSPDHEVRRRAR